MTRGKKPKHMARFIVKRSTTYFSEAPKPKNDIVSIMKKHSGISLWVYFFKNNNKSYKKHDIFHVSEACNCYPQKKRKEKLSKLKTGLMHKILTI